MPPQQIYVTFTLEQQIELILGNEQTGLSNSIIPEWCAEQLVAEIPVGDLRWKVTKEVDKDNKEIFVLWRYAAWADSNDRRDKAKAWQEKVILEGWIEHANVSMIATAIMEQTKMNERDAQRIAGQILRKGKENVMTMLNVMFGIEKLVTKKEEL